MILAQVELIFVAGACMIADSSYEATAGVPPYRALCPVVIYNPQRLFALPPPLALYVIHHEAGHIQLEHGTKPPRPPSCDRTPIAADCAEWNQMVRTRELEADCHAAKALGSRWPEILAAVREWLANTPDPVPPNTDRATYRQIAAELKRCGGP